ncbi:hypothetical protein PTKIN_Ptkin19aG0006600 [Pterospermum kingtungense]
MKDNLWIDSSEYRRELLSPAAIGDESVSMAMEDEKQLARSERVAIYASNMANLTMKKANQYRYPIGKNKMQPAQPERDPEKEKWMVGIMIAMYTMVNWANTVMDNVWGLIRRTASAIKVFSKANIIWNHHKEFRHIETIRAYTFGSHYFVEVYIVFPEDMSLSPAHNIGQALEDKLEQLPEVK